MSMCLTNVFSNPACTINVAIIGTALFFLVSKPQNGLFKTCCLFILTAIIFMTSQLTSLIEKKSDEDDAQLEKFKVFDDDIDDMILLENFDDEKDKVVEFNQDGNDITDKGEFEDEYYDRTVEYPTYMEEEYTVPTAEELDAKQRGTAVDLPGYRMNVSGHSKLYSSDNNKVDISSFKKVSASYGHTKAEGPYGQYLSRTNLIPYSEEEIKNLDEVVEAKRFINDEFLMEDLKNREYLYRNLRLRNAKKYEQEGAYQYKFPLNPPH